MPLAQPSFAVQSIRQLARAKCRRARARFAVLPLPVRWFQAETPSVSLTQKQSTGSAKERTGRVVRRLVACGEHCSKDSRCAQCTLRATSARPPAYLTEQLL